MPSSEARSLAGTEMVVRPQGEVHLAVREREIELVLTLDQTVRIGRRIGVADLVGQPEMARQRVDLRLVQVRDGLQVGRAIAVLHEEALVVLQAVGRPDHGVVQPVGVVVLQRLADPLLEAGRGDDLEVRVDRQARFLQLRRPVTAR